MVIGDDRALLRTVRALHSQRRLAEGAVSLIPVGPRPSLSLARALGVPQSAVWAARTALDGVERPLDLLLDDRGGLVLDGLCIPGPGACPPPGSAPAGGGLPHWLQRGARSLARSLAAPLPPLPGLGPRAAGVRLRIEADGVLLADSDRPVYAVSVRTAPPHTAAGPGGLAEVEVHRAPQDRRPVRVRARAVTVHGQDFRYRADSAWLGPVRRRTWTVQPSGWRLTVPEAPG